MDLDDFMDAVVILKVEAGVKRESILKSLLTWQKRPEELWSDDCNDATNPPAPTTALTVSRPTTDSMR